jgi:hypothetical protein
MKISEILLEAKRELKPHEIEKIKRAKEREKRETKPGQLTRKMSPSKAAAVKRKDAWTADTYGEGYDMTIDEEPASRALCTSGKPDSALGASQLSSCKSQGYRSREGGKSHKVGQERVKVRGKKIKGKKYGGPLPDWS